MAAGKELALMQISKQTFDQAIEILTNPKTGRISFLDAMNLNWDQYRYLLETYNNGIKQKR